MSGIMNLEPLHSITDGDTEYELDLISNLVADCDELMGELIQAFEAQDLEKFGSLAHKFKGSLLYVAGEPMASYVAALDKEARRENKFPSKETFEQIQKDFNELKDALNDYMDELE